MRSETATGFLIVMVSGLLGMFLPAWAGDSFWPGVAVISPESIESRLQTDPEQTLEEAKKGLNIALKEGNETIVAEWQLLLGKASYKTGDNEGARQFLTDCLAYFHEEKMWLLEAEALNILGLVERMTGSYQKALMNHNLALEVYKSQENLRGQAYSLNLIGVAYRNLGDDQDAEAKYFEGLAIVPEQEFQVKAALFNSLGSLYWYQKDTEKAQSYYEKALSLYPDSHQMDDTFIGILNNLGNTYRQERDYTKAMEYYQRAIQKATQKKDLNLLAVIKKNIGKVRFAMGDLERSESQLKEALAIAQDINLHRVRLECLESLSELYKAQERYLEAWETLSIYLLHYEEQIQEQSEHSLSTLKATHEIQLQEKRLELLKAQRDEARLVYSIVFLVLAGLVIIAWLSRYRIKARAYEAMLQKDHELLEKGKQIFKLQEGFDQVEDRYQRFFDSAPDAILVFEPETGLILTANSSAHQVFKTSDTSLVGESIYPFFPGEFKAMFIDSSLHTIDRLIRDHETDIHLKDGTVLPVEISFHDLNFDGKDVFQIIVRDLTKRKKLEGQLIQSQKMEAIGSLAGGISHDFNNLLTVIRGYCEVIQLTSQAPPPFHKQLQEIDKAAEKAQILTRQLLAFSRKQVQRKQVFSLNELMTDMLKMLRPLIGEAIQIVTRLHPDLGAILADRSQMEQVILNLAINARDAMPHGGILTFISHNRYLLDEEIHPEIKVSGQFVQLSVQDSGIGMEPEVQAQIFEPFFSTKKVQKGTGLGLSMVYGIVKQHQGFIRVNSSLGKGTVFDVFLPISVPENSEDVVPRTIHNAYDDMDQTLSGNETILVVEDDSRLRSMLLQVLQERGYRTIEARNGAEGLKYFESLGKGVDLVLTDMVMPGMNGKDMVDAMDSEFPRSRVVYMSGYSEQVMKFGEIEAQGSQLIEKPFKPSELLELIRETLERE